MRIDCSRRGKAGERMSPPGRRGVAVLNRQSAYAVAFADIIADRVVDAHAREDSVQCSYHLLDGLAAVGAQVLPLE